MNRAYGLRTILVECLCLKMVQRPRLELAVLLLDWPQPAFVQPELIPAPHNRAP